MFKGARALRFAVKMRCVENCKWRAREEHRSVYTGPPSRDVLVGLLLYICIVSRARCWGLLICGRQHQGPTGGTSFACLRPLSACYLYAEVSAVGNNVIVVVPSLVVLSLRRWRKCRPGTSSGPVRR